MNIFAKAAIGAAAAASVAIIGVALLSDWSTVGATSHPAPSLSAVSSPVDLSIIRGWPGTRINRAGRYSWDGRKSWMHNPSHHDIGVSIIFSALANHYESGPTAITIAGYGGTYQELPTGTDGVRTEIWLVDIDDTRVTFTVEAQPGSTAAQLAEAHAILESIRSEPKDGARLRLTFTLPKGWDSG